MEQKVIGVDFGKTIVVTKDGVIVDFVPHANRVLERLIKAGHSVILWTARSKEKRDEALTFCHKNNIRLTATNYNPIQGYETDSPKIKVDLWIDDKAIGVPNMIYLDEKVVDWLAVEELLMRQNYL